MKQTVTMHTVINLEKDRQSQYNEDYELMYNLCKATSENDVLDEMKRLYEMIVEHPAKEGYIAIYEVEDDNTHVVVAKYIDKQAAKDI